ncbi:hypothetical protein C8R45DRAFT_1156552 [Mycena sanguinolenta]|nr:hypothetical protein C8R45DRAFT_1156552 [Mycena sanguinolenta]
MSVHMVLPPLNDWAQQHLFAILKATTQTEFDSAFDAFLSKNATITVNGKKVSRDEYQKQLQGKRFDEAGATVQLSGAVEAGSIQAGVVGLFYAAAITEHIVVRDAPVEKHITSSLNLVLEEEESLVRPHWPPGTHGFFDGRRVSALNQIIVAVSKD